MTDAEFEEQKGRVEAIANKWLDELGLKWWTTTFDWRRESPEATHTGVVRLCDAARCFADWRYMEATIQVYLPEFVDRTDGQIERLMVHEFCHMLINETREAPENWLAHEERVCTTLTSALLWVRDAAKDGKL